MSELVAQCRGQVIAEAEVITLICQSSSPSVEDK